MSPGSVTEQLHFYAEPYTPADRTGAGGGLPEDGEDIDVIELDVARPCTKVARPCTKSAPVRSPTPRPSCCCSGPPYTAPSKPPEQVPHEEGYAECG